MNLFNKALLSANPTDSFITPVTPYLICDHFVSTEVYSGDHKYICTSLDLKGNDLLKHKNYEEIQELDIVQVQVDHFDFFYDEILPILSKRNISIILITSQWHLPQVHISAKTDALLNHKSIHLWISQNPIYSHPKYMAFPYGINHYNINMYIQFVNHYVPKPKTIKILNQRSSCHGHLPSNHIRRQYPIFGNDSGPSLAYWTFLENISNSEFVISTTGDREDCYRHYESIGIDAIPISNVSANYQDIFDKNMVYSYAEEMIDMIQNQKIEQDYILPNKDILTIDYWLYKIHDRLDKLSINKE